MKKLILAAFALTVLGASAATAASINIHVGGHPHRHQVCSYRHHHRVCSWR